MHTLLIFSHQAKIKPGDESRREQGTYRELHGKATPVERGALACSQEQVKLFSSKQEPDTDHGLPMFE